MDSYEELVDEFLDESSKDPEELYFEALSNEELRVPILLERLVADGKLTDETIIQFGASTAWLWIGKYKDIKEFDAMSKNDNLAAKKNLTRLEKAVDNIVDEIPKFHKENKKKVSYLAEYSYKMIGVASRLRDTEIELRNAIKTIRWGEYNKRRVIEVYRSIQDPTTIMVHIVGDESGKYWDISEVERDKKGVKN